MNPKIRFESEVVNDYPSWGKQPLGNIILKMSSGLSRQLKTENVGLAVIRSNNMADKYTTNKDIKYWYEDDPQGANTSNYILEEGDILVNFINSLSQIGKTSLFRKLPNTNAIYTTNILRLKLNPSQVNELFFFYFTKTITFENYIRAITKPAVNQASFTTKEFVQLEVPLPCLQEQQKIADFLTSVDTKTSQLTEKYRLLKDYKKGVMQQIFSQKIGFKDDDGSAFPEWKKEKIGRYLEPYKELVTADTNIPILTSSRTGLYLQERSVSNEGSYGVVPLGYFTYRHMSDDLIFKFNINTFCERGAVSKEYPVFKTVGMDSYFLQLQLNEGNDFKRFAIQQKLGGTRTRLYFKNLRELQLNLPCLEEQQKIAQFLQSLDKKIDAVNEQIEQTKLFKKGLLQQMFV